MNGFKFGNCSRTCGLKLFGSSGGLCDELRAASNWAWTVYVSVVDYPEFRYSDATDARAFVYSFDHLATVSSPGKSLRTL